MSSPKSKLALSSRTPLNWDLLLSVDDQPSPVLVIDEMAAEKSKPQAAEVMMSGEEEQRQRDLYHSLSDRELAEMIARFKRFLVKTAVISKLTDGRAKLEAGLRRHEAEFERRKLLKMEVRSTLEQSAEEQRQANGEHIQKEVPSVIRKEVLLALKEFFSPRGGTIGYEHCTIGPGFFKEMRNLSVDMDSEPELSNAAVDQSVGNKLIFELNEKINELKNKNLDNERLAGVCQEKYKRFDTMVVRMGQEIEDLRRDKLAAVKTMQELKREIIEANKTIEELRLKKSESDKVAELYKSRLENLSPRIGKIKEDIADMLTMNVGNKVGSVSDVCKLATLEEEGSLNIPGFKGEKDNIGNVSTPDDAENVAVMSPWVRPAFNSTGGRSGLLSKKGPHASGTRLMSGEGRLSNIARSSYAAGDTIQIHDSDDETNSDGASDVSNRCVGSNVGENHEKECEKIFVQSRLSSQRSKRNRTGLGENLFPSWTTKKKRNTHTSDEASVDSEDESLSDSTMNELIASLRTRSNKWTHKSDMVHAFEEDEELCMNAVCALYRQQAKSKGRSNLSKNGGFSPADSISGCALAEYLIDGDKELRLRKSVAEVKKLRPDVISRCRKLAKIYIDKLFTIYCSGEDPFLGR